VLKVVKVGGNELDRPGWLAAWAAALARAGGPVVVIHGGGRAITALSGRLGLPAEKADGLRRSSPDVAAAVEMALGGPVNRQVVAALRAAGLDAVGLSGVDGGLLVAEPLPGTDLGHVGRVVRVRTALLESLLLAGLTPVLAPMAPAAGDAPEAVPLNVNADDAAAAVAGALGAAELLQVSDVPGVLFDGVPQPSLAAAEIPALVASGAVTGGMVAKLRAAAAALDAGARAVRIGGLDMLASPTAGTRVLDLAARAA
jgi:acetylglutamate kinase